MTVTADQNLLDCLFEDTMADGQGEWDRLNSPRNVASDQADWNQHVEHLHSLHQLEPDWDGQRAIPPEPALIDGAIQLACWLRDKQAPTPHFATAGVNGTVQFEWINHPKYSLMVEVVAADEAEVSLFAGNAAQVTTTLLHW